MTRRLLRSFDIKVEGLAQLEPLRTLIGREQFRYVMEGIASQVTERIREQSNPANGEFPLVTAFPVSDDAMVVEVEATAGTHAFLEKRLPEIGFHFRDTGADPAHAPRRAKRAKPAVGSSTLDPPQALDLSEVATRIARLFVEQSEMGLPWEVAYTAGELHQTLGVAEREVDKALAELKALGCVYQEPAQGRAGPSVFAPSARLFVKYDTHWKGWTAAADAVLIGREVQAGTNDPEEIAHKLGWEPRRLNPALEYLIERDLVAAPETAAFPFVRRRVQGTDATRRFLRMAP